MTSSLSLIYGAGLFQAVFLVCALASLRVRNGTARWLLIAMIVTLSILLLEEFLDVTGHSLRVGLGLAVEFALPPTIYLFVNSLATSKPDMPRQWAWHFAPLAAATLVLLWLNLGFRGHHVSLSNPDMRAIIVGIVTVKIGYFLTYTAATLRLTMPHDASVQRRSAFENLRTLIKLSVAAYLVVAVSFYAFLTGLPWIPDSDLVGGIILSANLYALGYFSLVNRAVFDLRDPYPSTTLLPEEAYQIRARANRYVGETEAFRDPDFSLPQLAGALGLAASRLSQALNAGGGSGFHRLVNEHRLRAYRALRANNTGKTVLELALEAGFNSKATFYRVLKSAEAVDEPQDRCLTDTAPKLSGAAASQQID